MKYQDDTPEDFEPNAIDPLEIRHAAFEFASDLTPQGTASADDIIANARKIEAYLKNG